jgi:hypothetical protein
MSNLFISSLFLLDKHDQLHYIVQSIYWLYIKLLGHLYLVSKSLYIRIIILVTVNVLLLKNDLLHLFSVCFVTDNTSITLDVNLKSYQSSNAVINAVNYDSFNKKAKMAHEQCTNN